MHAANAHSMQQCGIHRHIIYVYNIDNEYSVFIYLYYIVVYDALASTNWLAVAAALR